MDMPDVMYDLKGICDSAEVESTFISASPFVYPTVGRILIQKVSHAVKFVSFPAERAPL